MTAYAIDGKAIAAKVRSDVAADVARQAGMASCQGWRWC
jgi:hypothetical protein